MKEIIFENFKEHLEVLDKSRNCLVDNIQEVSKLISDSIQEGGKLIICGNGGSAADSQHIAAELVGRFKKERKGLPAVALTTDTSILTAVGNDYGFDKIYARQIEAIAENRDVFVGISTSGNSQNIIEAAKAAKKVGCSLVGLSGMDGGELSSLCKFNINVPSKNTARIQEVHIFIGHIICEILEKNY